MEYVLDETTVSKFYQFGINVFDLDKKLPQMEVAKKAIQLLADFLFKELKLNKTLSEIGIDDSKFEIMAQKACGGAVIPAFKPLDQKDIVKIYKMCL